MENQKKGEIACLMDLGLRQPILRIIAGIDWIVDLNTKVLLFFFSELD